MCFSHTARIVQGKGLLVACQSKYFRVESSAINAQGHRNRYLDIHLLPCAFISHPSLHVHLFVAPILKLVGGSAQAVLVSLHSAFVFVLDYYY